MIKGTVDLSFLTQEMLDNTDFAVVTFTGHANGYWEEIDVTHPKYAEGSDVIYQSFGEQCPQWVFKISELFVILGVLDIIKPKLVLEESLNIILFRCSVTLIL